MFLLGLFCVVVGVVVVFVKHKKMCAETNSTDIEKNMWIREIALHTRKYRVTTCMTCNDIFSFISSRFWLDFCSNLTPRHTHTHIHAHTHHTSHLTKAHEILYTSLTLRFIIILSLPLPTTFAMCFTFNQINHPYPTPWSMSLTEKEFRGTRYFRRRNIDQCTFFSRT